MICGMRVMASVEDLVSAELAEALNSYTILCLECYQKCLHLLEVW